MAKDGLLLLGLDPGLQATGWGVIEAQGTRLRHVSDGTIRSKRGEDTSARLLEISNKLQEVFERFRPSEIAMESSFFHLDANAALKLGKVCGVCMITAGKAGIPIREYAPNLVKSSVVGYGHADKQQVRHMVARLLAGVAGDSEHASDALAVAICHAQHRPLERAKQAARAAASAAAR
ncbi:MAG: crossover junction endodeoxyribonuclease RuvC [Hyphomicrobiales bacterium]|nr:crossover junction endodeoxyribonuclease RuvC [Hyphomicrobiales bacterium]MCY4033350.1 crossover junction endodeoxyribonuclease RuvC [Hyphomicrobiales bacterium]MCY4039165.1 crossover junction endodeoxyribonuclease RuvC [Hyphomicrobiales bacterium]